MLHLNWRRFLRQLSARHTFRTRRRPAQRFRARLEELESRLAPASFAVNAHLQISQLDNQREAPGETHAIVFFESSVANYQVLRQGLAAGTDAVVLDSGGDGIREMAAFLAGRHDLAAVGLVAHGAPGAVELGTATLKEQSVGSHGNDLAVLGSALGRGGELDLWSCDVAAGAAGASLVQDLARATGTAVAAADHAIGATALGGDWDLDVQTAGVRGFVPFSASALTAFPELLGTWTPAASMSTARSNLTATLLLNDEVLIVGGTFNSALSSAELYDPVNNTWSATAPMAVPLDGVNSATLLLDGRVLVLVMGNTPSSVVELYDPVSNTWSVASPMAQHRYGQTATLLTNGKVLVAGGIDFNIPPPRFNNGTLSSAELYDPVTKSWSSAGHLATARDQATATLLSNGKVLVTGGANLAMGVDLSSAELYDPTSNSWSAAGSMAMPRRGGTATLLGNGKVLVTGGNFSSPSPELFDPATNSWSAAASMAIARFGATATLLSNGQVLITGGLDANNNALSSAELYDPATDTWSSAGDMATARAFHAATPIGNDNVLVAGGFTGSPSFTALSSCELYVYAPGASLDLAGFPSSTTVGVAGSFTVAAEKGDGTINTGYTGTIQFTSSDPKAILSADYTFTAADHGVHTFTATFKTGGSQWLRATDTTTALVAGFEGGIKVFDPAVVNPALSTISITPTTIVSGGSATVTLTARNDVGNPVTTGGLPFTFGATGGNLFSSAAFSNLTDNHHGTYTATFTASTALAAATYTITSTLNGQTIATPLPSIAVLPAVSATQLAITNLTTTSIAAGGPVTFTLTAEDMSGTVVPSYTGTVLLTSSDGHTALGSNGLPTSYTFAASDNGTHTFTIALTTAGSQTITATDQANNALTATTGPITVSAGPFSKLLVDVPGGNIAVAGNPFLVTVQATDFFGNPVTSFSGPPSVTIAAGPPDPQSSSPIAGTLSSSGFGFFLASPKTAGSYILTATAGSFSGISGPLIVAPADASYFTVKAPTSATTGSAFNVVVSAFDHFGNLATGYNGRVHFTSSDTSALLPADSTLTDGVGTVSVALKTAGSQTITATDMFSTNPTITGTASAISTRGLTVSGFTPTPTGFMVTFSKPIVASDISLYGGTVANPVQNVALVGKNTGPIFGAVNGSLIIDPSGTSATFKASSDWLADIASQTNGLLPNDTWTVTLQSGTGNRFFDALGAPLDGANNGGHANYVTTFTTANDGRPALTIPDFARGPDGASTIKVPNNIFAWV